MNNIDYTPFPECLSDCQSFQRTSSINAKTIYLGKGIALCVVAGRFKMFVPTQDLSLAPHLMLEGYWESWISVGFYKLLSTLNPRNVINVGANLGYYSLLAASLLPNAKIEAYEPQPDLSELIQRSCMINGFNNVETHSTALGSIPGTTWLRTFGGLSGSATLLLNLKEHNLPGEFSGKQAISVNITTLDLEDDTPIDFMIIDAEGFEFEVLKGGERRLDSASVQAIILEFAPSRYPNRIEFVDWIASKNYDIFRINHAGEFEPLSYDYLRSMTSSYIDLVLTKGLTYEVPNTEHSAPIHNPPPPDYE